MNISVQSSTSIVQQMQQWPELSNYISSVLLVDYVQLSSMQELRVKHIHAVSIFYNKLRAINSRLITTA